MVAEDAFTYMNEDAIDSHLKCTACQNPLVDPVSLPSTCQQTFCRQCLFTNYAEHAKDCPKCQDKQLEDHQPQPESPLVDRILGRLLVKCTRCSEDNIKRADFSQHAEHMCVKRIVSCSAKDVLCEWAGPYENLAEHTSTCSHEQLRETLLKLLNDKQRFEQLKPEHQALSDQSRQMEQSNQQLHEKVKRLELVEQEYNRKQAENARLTMEIAELTKQKAEGEEKLKVIDVEFSGIKTELDESKKQNQSVIEQVEQLQIVKTDFERLKTEHEQVQQQCQQHGTNADDLHQRLQEKTGQYDAQSSELSGKTDQCAQLTTENQWLREQLDQSQLQISTLQASAAEMRGQLNQMTPVFEQSSQLNEELANLRSVRDEHQALFQHYQQLTAKNDELQGQLKTLTSAFEQNQKLKRELQDLRSVRDEHQALFQHYQQLAAKNDELQHQSDHLEKRLLECKRRDELNAIEIKRLQTQLKKPSNTHSYFRDEKNGYRNERLEDLMSKGQRGSLINFNGESLNDDDVNIIIHETLTNPRFRSVLLWNNCLTDLAATKLFSSLQYNSILRELSISKNRLSDQAIQCLSTALAYDNGTLTRLTLSSSRITDQGVTYLAAMLKSNNKLIALGLQDNQISDQSMNCFCEVLQFYNQTIEEVCLGGNPLITDSSVDDLVDTICVSPKLAALWLWNCGLSSQAKLTLQQASAGKAEFDLKI